MTGGFLPQPGPTRPEPRQPMYEWTTPKGKAGVPGILHGGPPSRWPFNASPEQPKEILAHMPERANTPADPFATTPERGLPSPWPITLPRQQRGILADAVERANMPPTHSLLSAKQGGAHPQMQQMAAAQAPIVAPQQAQQATTPNNQQKPFDIDWSFTEGQEGLELTGYIPKNNGQIIGNSGVTVGYGVDLGQWTYQELSRIITDQAILAAVAPYLGLQDAAAETALKNRPLNLTQQQAETLYRATRSSLVDDVAGRFDNAQNFVDFVDLPREVQTVIADVAFQYGPNLGARTPKFWAAITAGDWNAAYRELRNFQDAHPTRRQDEAVLLLQVMMRGNLPHP
jgi:hypothetical protein